MSDYSEQGAIPVEDAAVEHPPTVDEVMQQQRREFPEQAATSSLRRERGSERDEEALAQEAAEQHEG